MLLLLPREPGSAIRLFVLLSQVTPSSHFDWRLCSCCTTDFSSSGLDVIEELVPDTSFLFYPLGSNTIVLTKNKKKIFEFTFFFSNNRPIKSQSFKNLLSTTRSVMMFSRFSLSVPSGVTCNPRNLNEENTISSLVVLHHIPALSLTVHQLQSTPAETQRMNSAITRNNDSTYVKF